MEREREAVSSALLSVYVRTFSFAFFLFLVPFSELRPLALEQPIFFPFQY